MDVREFKKFMRDGNHWDDFVDAVWAIRAPDAKPWSSFETEYELWESREGKRLPIKPEKKPSFACDGESDPRLVGGKFHDILVDGSAFRVGIFDGAHTDYGSVTYANVIEEDGSQLSIPAIFWDEANDDEPERFEHVSARPVPAQ